MNAFSPLPEFFVSRMTALHGAAGHAWCAHLPQHLAELARNWDLRIGEPHQLSFNYVCRAWRSDGTEVVLKTAPPNQHFDYEAQMLTHYAGRGAARLLQHDSDRAAMLIAHVAPGHRLLDAVHDDDTATRIVAELIMKSTSAATPSLTIPTIVDWAEPLGRIAHQYPEFTLISPAHIALAQHIFATDAQHTPWYALHGDLHHENILAGANEWVIIDPQGIQAPQAYETTAFLRNHYQQLAHHGNIVGLTRRRIEIFATILGVAPITIARLNFAAMVLSAWWCYEDERHINPYELKLVAAMHQVMISYDGHD